MSFGLVAPSLTPTSTYGLHEHESHIFDNLLELDGNPAFTVYDVDPDTYDIMDAKVYIGKMNC